MCLKKLLERPCHQRGVEERTGERREVQKIEQAERRRSSSLSNTVMRKNGARVDQLTGVGG